jgi:hypothetical protein
VAEENLGTAVLSIVVDSKGLEESLTKAKQQIQKTSRELQRSLTAAPINPVTGRPLRDERNDPVKAAIQQRRAEQRALQTAGGSGLGQFLRDVAAREEGEKRVTAERIKGYKQAEFAEKTLQALTEKRAGTAARAAGGGLGGRVGGAVGSALIGGGFPLLFGQGVGAAAGGAAGGAIGGAIGGQFGFGLSIVGTIVGDAFDEALNKGKALAAALDNPIGKFSELQQAALLSSSAVEKNIAALIEQGRNAEAAALIQLDLAQRYGDTSELDGLRSAYDELGRSFNQLSVITAKYVAGPLTEFINKLASSFQAISSRSLFEERLNGAPREVEAEARARVRSAAGELSGSGLSTAEVANKAYQAGLVLLDQRLGKTQDVLAAEQALATAKQRQNKLDSLTTQQIQAQVQGYDLLNLQIEKQRIETQKLQDLQAAPAEKAGGINRKALEDTVKVEAQINNLLQDRAAQRGLEAAQDKLKSQSIAEQIAATQALAKAERGVARETLATTQAIQLGINEARRREQEIGAQIDAARQRGGDAGEQDASRLVEQQRIAANETRLELEKGALALTEAGLQLRDNLRNAVVEFTRIRSDPQGLNRFLNPQQREERAQRDFQLLIPQFREAQGRFRQLTGADAPDFTGSFAGVNESIRDFINAVQTEREAGRNLAGTQQALATNLDAYNTTIADLTAVTRTLTDKNWLVNVAVSGAQSAISGDVLNGAVSP